MRPYCYNYGINKIIVVSENTVNLTPITFNKNGGYFEPESINYFFNLVNNRKDNSNILDIGAQSGLYTLYAKFIPTSSFFSYEPNIEVYNLLKENCQLNNINNAILVNKGLSDSTGILTLKIPYDPDEKGLSCFGNSPIRFSKYYISNVEVTTIDNDFFDKDIPVHFIKCDTEGWEVNILKGGEKTIKKWKPELFLEVNETNLNQCSQTKDNLMDILYEYGYSLKNIVNNENYHFTHTDSVTN